MSVTIAPVPSIGELISQWGIYFNNSATGFRFGRNYPNLQLPGVGSSTGTSYETSVYGGGIGLAAAMICAPSASANIRPEIDLSAGYNNAALPEFVPWCNLVDSPVTPGLPDFRYTWESWHWADLTVASVADEVITGVCWVTPGGPGYGQGSGNPGNFPNNPCLGFWRDRSSPNWFARLYPGGPAPGTWLPVVDVDTGVPSSGWNRLGMTVARVAGNAVLAWQVNGTQVAEFRPLASVPLYNFVGRFETGPSVNAFRVSGASDDGLAHYVGGPGPLRIWLQS